METQMVKYAKPPQCMVPASQQNPTNIETNRKFLSMDRKTFSRLIQCQTRHAHTGKYYRQFVQTQETNCSCRAVTQTQQHIMLECKIHQHHRHTLGHRRHTQWGRLTGTYKGIKKLT